MSFKAKFKCGGVEANLLSTSYTMNRSVDSTGRPSSDTYGGAISCTIEATASTELFEWMCNPFEKKDGTITWLKKDSEAKLKELAWKDGYLVDYSEQFADGSTFTAIFTISCREFSIGNGTHVNEWPDET
ncbi:MAG TPA: type VI secretion system tube protein TssD [Phnomibacter sp.]|nr:type VI secretion system tube protein TssD [Phnomibacter sp.]